MRFTGENGGGRKSGASPTPFLGDADSLATIRIRYYCRWRKNAKRERERERRVRERKCERKRGRERENEHANLLKYNILHTIITLDIHYVYCIYVSIIVVSYIAMMMMMIMSMIITDDFGEGEVKTHTRNQTRIHTVRKLSHTCNAREPGLCGRGDCIVRGIFPIEN